MNNAKQTVGTPLWASGDLNGFFGLFSNSLTNFLTAVGLLSGIAMPGDIVFGKIVPGAALSIALGNFILGWFARRMSVKENRSDVTAMPYGLSVPHYFAVALAVILPTYAATGDWTVAWATGVVWNLIEGIIMLVGAFVGPTLKKHIPRSAMLGALAGFALTFISGVPMGEVFGAPYIGLACFIILMVGWLAHKRLPFNMPAGAFAILVGTVIAWATGYLQPADVTAAVQDFGIPIPGVTVNLFGMGFAQIAPFLPAAEEIGRKRNAFAADERARPLCAADLVGADCVKVDVGRETERELAERLHAHAQKETARVLYFDGFCDRGDVVDGARLVVDVDDGNERRLVVDKG